MNELGALGGLVAKEGLDVGDVTQVQALADDVRRADGVSLKLNLPRSQWKPGNPCIPARASDFCYYDGGRLVGYAPLDGDGEELEVTAAVLPSHRRRGIFRLLLAAACSEAQERHAERLLLVSYPASWPGTAVVQALGLTYVFSEYRLEAQAAALPPLDAGRVRLIQANESSVTELARLRTLSFGDETKPPETFLAELRAAGSRYFLAEVDKERIGLIGVMDVGGSVYIRSVGILPEHRRRGHGRQLIAATMHLMLSEGHKHFALDVATDNRKALSLYQSCGFRETDSYDYHDLPLTEPAGF